MKSTGIVRKVDELGRVVIPVELRRNLGIAERDPLEIYVAEGQIILQKYQPNTEKDEVLRGLERLTANVSSAYASDIINRAMKLIK